MVFKKAQDFISIDKVHGMITWSRHYLRSEKREERSKHEDR